MTPTCRLLDAGDLAAAQELNRLAFGGLRRTEPVDDIDADFARPGCADWGLFDGGRLVAVAVDRRQQHWFGGRAVPAGGLASVSVAPADRGRGHARVLLTHLLARLQERGAALSVLYPTAPSLYRGLGWEQAGVLTWDELPTAALAGLRLPAGRTLRAAEPADLPAVAALYERVAQAASGYLDRTGPHVVRTPLETYDGVTLVLDADGGVEGFCSWDRGEGYGAPARLTVHDLVGLTGPATLALLAALGSWGSVTPLLRLRLPQADPARWLLPTQVPRATSGLPWMLRLVDAAAAVAARGWPVHLDLAVDLDLVDEQCPWNAGRRRLVVADGRAELQPGGTGALRLGPRALALVYAGGVSGALLRRAGLLDADPGPAAALDALAAGPPPALLDYF